WLQTREQRFEIRERAQLVKVLQSSDHLLSAKCSPNRLPHSLRLAGTKPSCEFTKGIRVNCEIFAHPLGHRMLHTHIEQNIHTHSSARALFAGEGQLPQ